MGRLLNRKELEEWSGGKLKSYTIGDLTRKNQIPHITIGKRLYLYDIEVIERWLTNIQSQSMNNGPEKLRKVNG